MEPARIAIVSVESYGNSDRSLALDSLCGALRAHTQHTVKTINSARCSFDQLIGEIQAFDPDILCLSVRPGGRPYLDRINEVLPLSEFRGTVVLGGLPVSASPDLFLANYPQAIAVVGEGEEAIVRLCQCDRADLDHLAAIPNLVFLSEGELTTTERRTAPNGYLATSYDDAVQALANGGICWVESSRGCSFNCSFCSNSLTHFTSGWRPLPLASVSRQLDYLASEGANIVSFADMNTFEDLDRLIELEAVFLDKPPSLKVRFDVRTDSIYNPLDSDAERHRRYEALGRLRAAGLAQVFVGYESHDSAQLRRLRKGVKPQTQDVALDLLKELNIDYVLGYIPFDPMMQLEELIPNLMILLSRGLLKHISTPTKQMRVQRGTALEGQMRDRGLLGSLQDNYAYYDYEYQDPRLAPISHIADYFYFTTAKVYRHSYITSMLRCMDAVPNLQGRFESLSYQYKLLELNLLCDCAASCLRGDTGAPLVSLIEHYDARRMALFLQLKGFYESLLGDGFAFFQADMRNFCDCLEDPVEHELIGVDASDVVAGNTRFRF